MAGFRLTIAVLTGVAVAAGLAGAPRIASYHAQIRSDDGESYNVDVSIQVEGGAWMKPVHTLDGEVLGRITLDRPALPGETYRLHYDTPATGYRARIPLPVPELSTAGSAGSVVIDAVLPAGYQMAGDMFPVFKRNGSDSYTAELANIPGHVEFEMSAGGEASLRQRWLTPAVLSDCGVTVLVGAAFLLRLVWPRRTTGRV